jgi:probable HAF family extracellular repeat protein
MQPFVRLTAAVPVLLLCAVYEGTSGRVQQAAPTITSIAPATVPAGQTGAAITVNGSGFVDPGPGSPRLVASISGGGAAVTAVVVVSPTTVVVTLDTRGAATGDRGLTITNPDGQSVTRNPAVTITRAPSTPRYSLTLTPLHNDAQRGAAINAAGHMLIDRVVGGQVVFLWDGTTLRQIPATLESRPGGIGHAPDINDRGEVLFTERTRDGVDQRAAIWRGGALEFIGLEPHGGTFAGRINNHGAAVGMSMLPSRTIGSGFHWSGGTHTNLGLGAAYAINDLGHICGAISESSPTHAAFWYVPSQDPVDLGSGQGGVPDYSYFCRRVNDYDQSVGHVLSTGSNEFGFPRRALIWSAGSFHVLGDLGGDFSDAFGINNRGEVVGESALPPSGGPRFTRAFLWNGTMHDLTALVDWPQAGWFVSHADDINDAGQIAATICRINTGCRPARLDPIGTVPLGLTARVDGRTVSLSWQPPAAAVSAYTLEAGHASGQSDIATATVAGRSIAFSGIPDGTYFVRLRSQLPGSLSDPSNEVVFTVGPPGAPQQLAATWNGTVVNLSWSPPATGGPASVYQLEAGSGAGGSDIAVISQAGTTLTTPAPPGTYYIRVRGVSAAGVGPPSNEVTLNVEAPTLPGPPRLLVANRIGNSVTVSWSPPAIGSTVTSYVLEAGSATGLANLASVPVAGTVFTAFAPRGTYYLRVRAVNGAGTGTASDEITLVVP